EPAIQELLSATIHNHDYSPMALNKDNQDTKIISTYNELQATPNPNRPIKVKITNQKYPAFDYTSLKNNDNEQMLQTTN
ncbi:15314_t:CDS:2, partial [Racocetra fulgida]